MPLPRPRPLSALGLLAVVPAALYLLGRGDPTAVLAALNVLLIVASLAYMLSPPETGDPAP